MKNIIKRIAAAILSVVLIAGNITLTQSISSQAASETVSVYRGDLINYPASWNSDYYTYLHYVIRPDGSKVIAYCLYPSKKTPAGTGFGAYTADNKLLEKVMFYGYAGPGDKTTSYGSTDDRYCYTHVAASYAAYGASVAFYGIGNTADVLSFISYISSLPDPDITGYDAAVSYSGSVTISSDGLTETSPTFTITGSFTVPDGLTGHYNGSEYAAGTNLTLSGGSIYFTGDTASVQGTSSTLLVKGQNGAEFSAMQMDVTDTSYQSLGYAGDYVPDYAKAKSISWGWKTPSGSTSHDTALTIVKLHKNSDGSVYSVPGAVFTAYSDEACTNKLTDFTATDTSGKSTQTLTESAIKAANAEGYFYIKETAAPYGFSISSTVYELNINSLSGDFSLNTYDDAQQIKLSVTKYGTYGNDMNNAQLTALKGKTTVVTSPATFTITADATLYNIVGEVQYNAGDVIATITTDATGSGSATLPVLYMAAAGGGYTAGTVTVKETSAPSGYNLDSSAVTVTLSGDTSGNAVISKDITFTDTAVNTKIILTKYGSDGTTPVSGATYGLYLGQDIVTSDGTVINADTLLESGTTGTDGIINFSSLFPSGVIYYIKEITAPTGYLLDTKQYIVDTYDATTLTSIASPAGTYTYYKNSVTVTEATPKGKITVIKTGSMLSGATATADGYNFTYSQKNLSGATFALYAAEDILDEKGNVKYTKDDSCSTAIVTGTTGSDGKLEFINLYLGKYYLREISAPDGYVVNSTVKTVTVAYKDATTAVVENTETLSNDRVKFEISVVKRATGGTKNIAGAVYGLYAKENIKNAEGTVVVPAGSLIAKATTGTSAVKFSVDAPAGYTYYIKEISAPEGYTLSTTEYTVSVPANTANGKVYAETVYDEPITYTLTINKYSELTVTGSSPVYSKLPGASFKLYADQDIYDPVTGAKKYSKDDLVVDTKVTDKNGQIKYEKLIPAKYYIVETEAPVGYLIKNAKQSVDLTASDKSITVYNTQVKTGKVEIKKTGTVYNGFDTTAKAFTSEVLGIPGATYGIYAGADVKDTLGGVIFNKGTLVDSVTTDTNGLASYDGLYPGTYYIEETKAAEGYELDTASYTFTITNDGNTVTKEVTDAVITGKLKITKKDESGKALAGATFSLYAAENIVDVNGATIIAKDTFICSVVTGKDGTASVENLPVGKYKYKETKAPAGYVAEDTGYTEFTISGTSKSYSGTVENKSIKVSIAKQDADTHENVAGAKLELYKAGTDGKAEGDALYSWTTGTDAYVIEPLIAGTYILREKEAPSGYTTADDMTLVIDGTVENYSFTMNDTKTKVTISKQDITTKTELAGAELEIYKADAEGKPEGDALYSWTSTDTPHEIEMIPNGDYVLVETSAPEGYVVAESINFTISDEHIAQTVTMYDEHTKVTISKQDITTKTELAGAELEIYKADAEGKPEGDALYSWISTDTPHEIEMIPNGDYVLVETSAPDGYIVAESINFTISDEHIDQTVTMYDEYKQVILSKQDAVTGKDIVGAKLEVYKADADGNKTGSALYAWTTNGEPHVIYGMKDGDYILSEIQAPDGYLVSADVKFTVDHSETEPVKVVMKDDHTTTIISKKDGSTGKLLAGAKLAIYRADGTLYTTWTSSKDEAKTITCIPVGTYKLVELEAPEGYEKAEDIVFEVKATSQIQTVSMTDLKINIPYTPQTYDDGTQGSVVRLEDRSGVSPAVFIISGFILIAGAGATFFAVKRHKK